MNRKNLLQLADYIEANSDRYNQTQWGDAHSKETTPTCGTAGCIAGHACVLAGYVVTAVGTLIDPVSGKPKFITAHAMARQWLDLPPVITHYLFVGTPDTRWPDPWGIRWARARNREEQAQVAADLLRAIANGDDRTEVKE